MDHSHANLLGGQYTLCLWRKFVHVGHMQRQRKIGQPQDFQTSKETYKNKSLQFKDNLMEVELKQVVVTGRGTQTWLHKYMNCRQSTHHGRPALGHQE